jgi:hypothetical protein
MGGFTANYLSALIQLSIIVFTVIGAFYSIKNEIKLFKQELKSIMDRIIKIEEDRCAKWSRQDTINDSQNKYLSQMAKDVAVIKAQVEMYFEKHINSKK